MKADIIIEALKPLLSAKGGSCCILDRDCVVVWTSGAPFTKGMGLLYQLRPQELFKSAKKFLENADAPEEEAEPPHEHVLSMNILDSIYTVIVTPYVFEGETLLYTVTLPDPETCNALAAASDICLKIRDSARIAHGRVGDIIDGAVYFQDKLDTEDTFGEAFEGKSNEDKPMEYNMPNRDVVERQLASSCGLLVQIKNIIALVDRQDVNYRENRINISEIMDVIVDECIAELDGIRTIEYSRDPRNGVVKLSEKDFTMAMINIIQNALVFSPPRSPVGVRIGFEQTDAVITVTNRTLSEREARNLDERAGMGILLARQIFTSVSGRVELSAEGEEAVVTVTLPLASEQRGIRLSSGFRSFAAERYSPIRLFLKEIVFKETEKDTAEDSNVNGEKLL